MTDNLTIGQQVIIRELEIPATGEVIHAIPGRVTLLGHEPGHWNEVKVEVGESGDELWVDEENIEIKQFKPRSRAIRLRGVFYCVQTHKRHPNGQVALCELC